MGTIIISGSVAVLVGALFGILEKGNHPNKWGNIIFWITFITAIGACLSWSLNTYGESELVLEKEQPIYAFDDQEFYIQKSEEPAALIFSRGRMKSVYSFVTENENGRYVDKVNVNNVYFTITQGTPVLKTYYRQYQKRWYNLKGGKKFDHYEFCLPSYAIIENLQD